MKVLAIRGRNIASLEGDFVIDFTIEPLLSAGIFAISGPTGAGKSTILDTMCLALFAKTPRTEQGRKSNVRVKDVNDDVLMQSDPRFLLRRGTASGYAETDFLALNGHRYRARWSLARAREKEDGRLQNARISLINLDTGVEEPGKNSEIQTRIVELIGLSYDQFTRSILLAQNEFSTFLKAEHDEKAQLLEKLTGTEQYSLISRLIYEKNAEAREAYEKVHILIEGIELLSEEEEKMIRETHRELENRFTHLEKLKTEHQALVDSIRNTEKAIFDKQNQLNESTDSLKKASELVKVSKEEYTKAQNDQQEVESQYKKIQPELQAARKLDIELQAEIRSLKETEEALKEKQQKQKEAEDKLNKLIINQQEAANKRAKLIEWREKFKAKEQVAEQLSTLLLHLDNAAAAQAAKEKAEKACKDIQDQLQQLENKINELRKTADLPENEDPDKTTISCRSRREELLLEQARFVTEGDVKTLRDKLSEGTPCPVCGSKEHPYTSPTVHAEQEKLNQEIAQLTLRIKYLDNLSRLFTERRQPAEQLPREENEIKKQSEILIHSLKSADKHFGNDEWQANWLQGPESFRKTLVTFASDWKTNKEKLGTLEQQESIWKSEQQTVEHFLDTLRKETNTAQETFTNRSQALQKRQTERSALLEGKPVEKVEKEYSDKLDFLKSTLNKLLQTQTEQAGITEQLKGVTEQINKDLSKANNELAQYKQLLEEWITAYNSSNDEDIPLDKAFTDTRQQKTEITFRIRKQEENKQKVAGLQKDLDIKRQISERWAKLNELAGSADGAKFRRIAQGYTLDVLLNYANIQLRELTNRYYLERVPETLALQVIDRDMCDEVRTVHSLSGGESFLVSLALALGLSSLSSNRMKVESLFIDEGFGSLDADTLRIALDALESLRTQGRKIGVISHVQEMTERIPVQIRVNRAGNGRSIITSQ